VATKVFYAKGYEAASLQEIADEVGIKKASFFYYFSSKEDLLHAVLASIIRQGMENIRTVLEPDEDPLTRLWGLVRAHIDWLCSNLIETAVFLHERKMIPVTRRREILEDDYAYQAAFIETIREGQLTGLILSSIDPKLAALSILGSINWTYTWFRPGMSLNPDLIGTQFATMTINSIATPEALATWRRPA
jgi:AcrR family transcriptional regulator